ncbi:hypothetical protein [Pelistega suis]|uniref:VIT family protein n=1 Tax=Pelistega suis TaxID=1631957 RepID=A0A849P987_9BURK|nr:hypothetical protein [Pelistega suis]NOL51507.1 hypothetical protein [Pelistega suis]
MKSLSQFKDILDPIDRTSEILFGLLMSMTILGTLSIANAGQQDVRMVLLSVLGCNLAWGLVDGVMYLVRTLTTRAHHIHLAKNVQQADKLKGQQLLKEALSEELAPLVGDDEVESMRQRLLSTKVNALKTLRADDYVAALLIFLLVSLTTIPLALPFIFIADLSLAMQIYRLIALGMLFGCGVAFARYAGHAHPLRVGIVMAVLGSILTVVIMALGG